MTQDAAYRLRRETEAAKKLLAMLRDDGNADDSEIVETAIEGETNLLEAIASVIDQIDEEEIVIAGGEAKIADIQTRVSAKKHRVEMLRASIEQAMLICEQEKLNLPTATVFVSKRAPALVVESEADIPSEFFKVPEPPAPKLDRKALAAAIKDGREIAGARLDNGSISLSIRRK